MLDQQTKKSEDPTLRNAKRSCASTADVIVIGGGLHGCSAALQLALKGLDCTILERGRAGGGASSANAGGVRRIGRDPAELELAAASMDMWNELEDLTGSDGGFTRSGHVFVAENENEFDMLRDRHKRLLQLGYDFERPISGPDLRKAVPVLSDHIVGGLVAWDDGYADPFKTMRAFRDKIEALGARVCEGVSVEGVFRRGPDWTLSTSAGEYSAPVVVNCAGPSGGTVARWFGDEAPLSVEAPMMMVTTPIPSYRGPVLGRVSGRLSMKAGANGSVLVGGGQRATVDQAANKASIELSGIAKSALTLSTIVPAFSNCRLLRVWYGIEGYMPDGLPIIGRSPSSEGVYHAFGFSGHGFQLGPVVGRIMADLVVDNTTSFDLAAFELNRFEKPQIPDNVWSSSGLQAARQTPTQRSDMAHHARKETPA